MHFYSPATKPPLVTGGVNLCDAVCISNVNYSHCVSVHLTHDLTHDFGYMTTDTTVSTAYLVAKTYLCLVNVINSSEFINSLLLILVHYMRKLFEIGI